MTTIIDQLIPLADAHQAADEYRPGQYEWGPDDHGAVGACGVGCTIRDFNRTAKRRIRPGNHAALAKALGIPEQLPHLLDAHFEGLARADMRAASALTPRFLRAVKAGGDCALAWPRYAVWLLDDLPKSDDADVTAAVAGVRALFARWVADDRPTAAEFQDARDAARDDARDAAGAARAAARAARAAAWAAADAAGAAWAALDARAAAGDAAGDAFWRRSTEALITAIEGRTP